MSNLVTVIINNRDLLTWPKSMVEKIERFDSLFEIIILDNGSTYPPLLEWYRKTPHKIIFENNLGHKGPWVPKVQNEIRTDFYVVTDPDLDLEEVPIDCLVHLKKILTKYPEFGKIGLGLEIEGIPIQSPYFSHVNSYEKKLWEMPLIDKLFRAAPIDTTFAIYNKHIMNSYKVCGGRTPHPYVARHIPWALVDIPEEFTFYLERASTSSSYKSFINSLENGVTRNNIFEVIPLGQPKLK